MVNIPVVLCFDSRIILGASVTIKSLLENAKDDTCYDIRIFHSELNNTHQKNLQTLVEKTRHTMKFHYINPERFKDAPKNRGSWTEIVYYRLLVPEILTEYDKAIYSDVDVLIKDDLSELFNTDIEGYEAGAIPSYTTEYLKSINSKRYFKENTNEKNYMSGLILFNNKVMREEGTVQKFIETIKIFNKRLVFFDMDVFNITCNKIKDLPLNYCVFETLYEYTDVTKIPEYKVLSVLYSKEDLENIKKDIKIIHYAGKLGKPWQRKWVPDYYEEYINKLPKSLVKYTFRDFRKCLFTKVQFPEQHFDVALVNFYHSQNYGANLTAYALQEAVKNLGYTCAYLNEFNVRKKYNLSFGKLFVNKHLKLMPKFKNLKKAGNMADIYIAGSDQIFSPKYLKRKFKRDRYLLGFVNKNAKKMSFSASFSMGFEEFSQTKPKLIEKIKKELSSFDFISVREDSGVDICKKIFYRNAEWVIDPVFLLNRNYYKNLTKNIKTDYKNKIVTYILDKNPAYEKLVNSLSKKYNCKTESIAAKNLCTEEWLKAFMDAEYIITDSFHGACFALLFNKKFIAIVNKRRGAARFISLKNIFKINQQFVSDVDNIDSSEIDFVEYNTAEINKIIETEKNRALETLSRELNTKNKSFITQNCTGCGACYNACPKGAITMDENSEGFLYPRVNTKLCVNCGKCKKTCPVNNPNRENLKTPGCYAVMADDETRLSGVSSGGASPIFMKKVIEQGGYVVGAVYNEDWRVIHKVSNNSAELDKFKGSKYFQSNTGNIYKQTEQLLKNGDFVLFTGTPCQIAGLKAYLKTDYEKLLTVDIVCHGVPSYKTFEMFIQNLLQEKDEKLIAVDFRSKKHGWGPKLTTTTTTTTTYEKFNDENSFMTAFLRNFSLRKSCFTCPFQKTPRQGDITIGDFWRIAKFKQSLDDKKGTSVVVINNKKGADFFEHIKSEFKLVEKVHYKYAIKGNKTLIRPTKFNPHRDEFMANVNKDNIDSLLKRFVGKKYKEKSTN